MFEDAESNDVKLIDLALAIEDGDFRRGKQDHLFYEYQRMLPTFLSPEIINKKSLKFCEKTDVWSLGCIIYNMITGIPPFYDDDEDNLKL